MKPLHERIRVWVTPAVCWLVAAGAASAATNLVRNGSFDAAPDPLADWQTAYTRPGESWYAGNTNHVAILPADGERAGVLRLRGTRALLTVPGQGVKVDSRPIPLRLDGNRRYRLTVWARSTGPRARVMLEGYRWQTGVTPHPDPALFELRKCYRFAILAFGAAEAGEMAAVPQTWTRGVYEFPAPPKSPIQARTLGQVEFVVVHIVAIGGRAGDLFIDDVALQPVEEHDDHR